MTAIQPLLLVLDAAEKARDEALSMLEGGQRQYDAARQQAQSLNDWRRDYQQRWQKQFQQSGGMEIMRCYQDFMGRLTDAQAEQDRRVEQARERLDRLRLELIDREKRVAAVSQLIDRRLLEQRRKAMAAVPVDAARQMAERLGRWPDMQVTYQEFAGLGHGPMLAASLRPALRMAAGLAQEGSDE